MEQIWSLKYVTQVVFAAALVTASCTSGFEALNTNSNEPTDVPSRTLLGNVIVQYARISSNYLGGLFSQHYAQNPYVLEDIYSTTTNLHESIWTNAYQNVVKNAKIIRQKAIAVNDRNMEAVSEILLAQTFHNLTDIFGDIPYFDAVRLDNGIATPRYDQQRDIYIDLLRTLKEASERINTSTPIEGDLLFSGDHLRWKKYANSLRLRIAMRMSLVDPHRSAREIEEILQSPDKYPLIATNEDNATLQWLGSTPYLEPWYETYRGDNDNFAVSKTLVDKLAVIQDPRLPVYATPARSSGTYVGAVNGPLPQDVPNRNDVSRIGTYFTANPAGHTRLFTAAETWLIIAEAAERGLTKTVSASEAYYRGIQAALTGMGIAWETAAFQPFLAHNEVRYKPGDSSGNCYRIRLQKWIALYLQGFEAWAEVRRTDVPVLNPAPGTRFPGVHNRPPFRVLYPDSERDLNATNYLQARSAAGVLTDADFFWGKQLWWDKRDAVY